MLTDDANGYVADAVLAVNVAEEPAEDIVVDNDGYDARLNVGWTRETSGSPWGPDLYRALTHSSSRWIEWAPELKAAGWYKVYARWTSVSSNPPSAPYTVYHDGGSTAVTLNQTKSANECAVSSFFDW